MDKITLQSFNKYDINKMNVEGKFSSDEVNSDFTKTFLGSDIKTQRKVLNKMDSAAKFKLFENIKNHAQAAGDEKSEKMCFKAIISVSASIIKDMKPSFDYKDLAMNTMKFMHDKIKQAKNSEQRGACNWSGPKVLTKGNFNGCVEAAKVFLALFNEAAAQKDIRSVECNYQSSFNVNWATPENLDRGEDPPGHALIKFKHGGESFLLDTAMLTDGLLDIPNGHRMLTQSKEHGIDFSIINTGTGYQITHHAYASGNNSLILKKINVSSLDKVYSHLENYGISSIIKHADKNGFYEMNTDKGREQYKLFDGIMFEVDKNPRNPFDKTTSYGATRAATRDYLKSQENKTNP